MIQYLTPLNDNEPYCTRSKLDTGTLCNYNCTFCYYKDKLDVNTEFDIIKQRIDYLVDCGITEIDLSGGESSYHPNWFDILEYASTKNLHISTISNGSMFSDYEFLKKSKEYGLKEVMFSIHGSNHITHDRVVQNDGAFHKIMRSVDNAKELDIIIRVNYVVTLSSIKHTKSYIDLITKINPLEMNFLTLNNFGVAKQYLSYEKSTTHIKQIIDNINIKYINVRYTPYCYMEGYEKYVCNTFQHIYDLFDWNMAVYDQRITPEEYKKNPLLSLINRAKSDRLTMYTKPNKCKSCKYLLLCDGVENSCKDDVFPNNGKLITETNHFRKGFYDNKYIDINP